MHYYKRNLGDYAKKAGRLTMLQHGSYTLLIDACYDREQFPTMEQAIEWCWAATPEEICAVQFVLSRFFVLQDGVYVQERIQEEITEYREKATKNQRIAQDREAKRKEPSTTRARNVNEAPPNHKPITNNQEPTTTTPPPSGEDLLGQDSASMLAPDDVRVCPVGQLVNLYHELMPLNPRIKVLNDTRKRAIRQRWKEAQGLSCKPFGYSTKAQGLEAWRKFFEVCAVSDFLTGRAPSAAGRPAFVADIDFIFSPAGFAKILENKYHREAA